LKKFLVLYLIPRDVMDDWAKVDPETRKDAEKKVRDDWDAWDRDHAQMLKLSEAGGRTKVVTAAGVADTRNDITLYSVVEAESHEAAARAFADHPHLTIPKASIQVMEVRPMGPPG
jgi:hypothetical protein